MSFFSDTGTRALRYRTIPPSRVGKKLLVLPGLSREALSLIIGRLTRSSNFSSSRVLIEKLGNSTASSFASVAAALNVFPSVSAFVTLRAKLIPAVRAISCACDLR